MIQKVDNIMRVNALPILEKACICWSDLIIPFNNEKEYDQIRDNDKKRSMHYKLEIRLINSLWHTFKVIIRS